MFLKSLDVFAWPYSERDYFDKIDYTFTLRLSPAPFRFRWITKPAHSRFHACDSLASERLWNRIFLAPGLLNVFPSEIVFPSIRTAKKWRPRIPLFDSA